MKIMNSNIINQWNTESYDKTIQTVLTKAANHLGLEGKHINIVLVGNQTIRTMNLEYRQKDYATDVLTFPDGYLNHLGDVIISIEKCEEQAKEYQHSFERELGFLVVHGLLHTLGYDHQNKEEEDQMNELQELILQKAKLYR